MNSHDDSLSLVLSSHALPSGIPRMFELFGRALRETNWADGARLKSQLAAIVSSMSNSVASSGHSYALSKAASGLSAHRRMGERLSGLDQLQFISALYAKINTAEAEGLGELSSKLAALADTIVRGKRVLAQALIADSASTAAGLTEGASELVKILGGAGQHCQIGWGEGRGEEAAPLERSAKQHSRLALHMPFSTSFAAQAFATYPSNVADAANLSILARLLRPLRLHPEIREKGGAYGGGASYSILDGVFSLYSYRDPDPLRSVRLFDDIARWLEEEAQISAQDLLEAKLSVFSDLDAPQSVNGEGLHRFLHGITDEERQERRDALFMVDLESLKRVARRHLAAPRSTVVLLDPSLPAHAAEGLAAAGFQVGEQFGAHRGE